MSRTPADDERPATVPSRWNNDTRICEGRSTEEILVAVIARFSAEPHWWVAGQTIGDGYREVVVFRAVPLQSLLVIGESQTAAGMRRLLETGAVAGWGPLPIAPSRTPLQELLVPLRQMAGNRSANLLARAGFTHVEEVAAVPDGCLRDIRGGGPKFLDEIRRTLALLGFPRPSPDAGPPPDWRGDADLARGLQVLWAWAMAEHGAASFGDVFRLAFDVCSLPPSVAAEWDRVSRRKLGSPSPRVVHNNPAI